jgi:hypothetical protein
VSAEYLNGGLRSVTRPISIIDGMVPGTRT